MPSPLRLRLSVASAKGQKASGARGKSDDQLQWAPIEMAANAPLTHTIGAHFVADIYISIESNVRADSLYSSPITINLIVIYIYIYLF